jgi:hypothetical protein
MALLDLLAYATEAAIFQTDQVPDRAFAHLAELLDVHAQADGTTAALLARCIARLEARPRAVLLPEFEALVRTAVSGVARVQARLGLVADPASPYPPDEIVRVTVLPRPEAASSTDPLQPTYALRQQVLDALLENRLLTTRVEVSGPTVTEVALSIDVVPAAGLPDAAALPSRIKAELRRFLDPFTGFDGTGWPFGRALFRSELFQRLEGVPGIDHAREQRMGRFPNGPLLPRDRIGAPGPSGLFRAGSVTVLQVEG